MDPDLMLRWMSETGAGSVRKLRERLAWHARTCDTPASHSMTGRWLRDLSALGHAEIDWDRDRWAVTPPAVARLPAADGTAVVAGCRRAGRLDRLYGCDVFVVTCPSDPPAPGHLPAPTAVLLRFDRVGALAEAAASLGGRYAGCAATRIATGLRPLALGDQTTPPAFANTTLRRRTDSGAFAPVSPPDDRDGLYRLRLQGRTTHLYRLGGCWHRCDLPTGLFEDYARQGRAVMRWRPEHGAGRGEVGTLFVDSDAVLPPLQARALTLCSGLPARLGTAAGTAAYPNVPHSVATAVAASLRQRLQFA